MQGFRVRVLRIDIKVQSGDGGEIVFVRKMGVYRRSNKVRSSSIYFGIRIVVVQDNDVGRHKRGHICPY